MAIEDYRRKLNAEQFEAVTSTEGPVLIIAGAGSGKTTVLINRVAYLIENGVNPHGILLLTFTNKAAKEMRTRAEKMLDQRCAEITACTFHSFCAVMLRRYGAAIGIDNGFSILSGSDASDIISILKTERSYDKIRSFPRSNQIISIISTSINKNLSIEEVIRQGYEKAVPFTDAILEIAKAYADYKWERQSFDYDDLLVYTVKLFQQNERVRQTVSDTYRYIMVDEYQDTNTVQDKILMLLRRDNRNLAVVGDDAQSIYAFRGSVIENILSFGDRMPDTKVIELTTNYRSNDEIVRLSNEVINQNATENYKKHMHGTFESGLFPIIHRCDDQREEAMDVLVRIMLAHDSGSPYSNFAVLIRSAMQSYYVESAFMENGIPYNKYGGPKFFDKESVQDVIAYLKVIANPADQIAWYRVLKKYYGIGKTFGQKLSALAPEQKYDLLLEHPFLKRAFADSLRQLHGKYMKWVDMPMDQLLPRIIKNYLDVCTENAERMVTKKADQKDKEFAKIDEAKEDLEFLSKLAMQYETPVKFLDAIVLDSAPNREKDGDCVTISTIHSAKGLEFDTVFVLDCNDGTCPSLRIDSTLKDINEELRCFYVAITRAKNTLIMYVPYYVAKYGGVEHQPMSRYLASNSIFNMVEIEGAWSNAW